MNQVKNTLVHDEIRAMMKREASQCVSPQKGELISNLFPIEQEGWRSQAGNQPQKLKQLSVIPSFQDGRPTLSKGLVETAQLHVQNRFEGCVLLRSTSQKLPEVYMFLMGSATVHIPMYLF